MLFDLYRGISMLEDIKLIMAGHFYVKQGWVYGPVQNTCHQIVYFPAGSSTKYVSQAKTIVLNKPCIIITPPGERHSYEFDPDHPVEHIFITFSWESEKDASDDLLGCNESLCLHSVEETFVPTLIKQILYLSSKKVYLWDKRCKLLLASALAELEGLRGMNTNTHAPIMDTQRSLPIHKALDYIDEHLSQPITVAEIAEEIGWTHAHFTRKFVQHTGITPQKAILIRRIERACQMLVQETRSISQIAYEVGFQDVHYFYRVFKKIKGITAAKYREKFSSPHLQHLSVTEELQTSYPVNRYFYND